MDNTKWPKITEKTSMDKLFEIHRKIWDHVIEHGHKPNTPYIQKCAFCEYAKHLLWNSIDDDEVEVADLCRFCPVRDVIGCGYKNGLYAQWFCAHAHHKKHIARELAIAIRNIELPHPTEIEHGEIERWL